MKNEYRGPLANPVGITTTVAKNLKQKFKFQHNGTSKGHYIPEKFDRQLPGTRDPNKPNYNSKLPKRDKLKPFPKYHNPHHVQLLNKWAKEPGPLPLTPRNRGRVVPLIGMSDTRRIRPEG